MVRGSPIDWFDNVIRCWTGRLKDADNVSLVLSAEGLATGILQMLFQRLSILYPFVHSVGVEGGLVGEVTFRERFNEKSFSVLEASSVISATAG
jgi:hypothetical protein